MTAFSGEQIFAAESSELLDDMEQALLALEDNPEDMDKINSVFRAAHTIKGSAGLFGYQGVIEFTHRVESVLDRARVDELTISGQLLSLLLVSCDVMGQLVEAAINGCDGSDTELKKRSHDISTQLDGYLDIQDAQANESDTPTATTAKEVATPGNWHISLQFGRDVLRNGMDPLSFLRYLNQIGDIENLDVNWDELPAATDMDPESCFLGLEIDLASGEDQATIENVFEFVMDDCELSVIPVPQDTDARQAEQDRQNLPADGAHKSTEIAAEADKIIKQVLSQKDSHDAGSEGNPAVSPGKQEPARETIRVSAEKLGELIDLVGELVISSANTKLLGDRTNSPELIESMENMARLIESIRDTGLGLRMVPIGETFNRFRRVVRDISNSLQKDIRLEINGADKELDKTVVEKIRDPLMHLVRNALDHGIESVDQRLAQGKPAKGTLRLNSYHDSGSIVIEVQDDGAGLSRDKILAKALELGLVSPEQELTDQDVFRLIFEPGFSTASEVTDVSGRGVGMDVVRRNIAELRGYVDVESWPGKGSRFSIRLPLTLAIIDGFLVRVGTCSYVIPLDMVEECIELHLDTMYEPGSEYINLHGEVLPFVRLGDIFEQPHDDNRRENIVVVKSATQKVGFVVDALLGEYQTVIKPLGRVFEHLEGISGATILGNGEVATIIDVPALVKRVTASESVSNRLVKTTEVNIPVEAMH